MSVFSAVSAAAAALAVDRPRARHASGPFTYDLEFKKKIEKRRKKRDAAAQAKKAQRRRKR